MPLNPHTESLPSDFDGWVRLFPLPRYVLFPGIVKGLHIFEPRYCEMLKAALTGDGLIAMAVLRPGWEADYLNSPPVYSTVCIGKIVRHEPTSDKRHNILLEGLYRARIQEEKPSGAYYRLARVELLDIECGLTDVESEKELRSLWSLARAYAEVCPVPSSIQLRNCEEYSLTKLVDYLSHELPLDLDRRVSLFEEADVRRRCAILKNFLASFSGFVPKDRPENPTPPEGGSTFPPSSLN